MFTVNARPDVTPEDLVKYRKDKGFIALCSPKAPKGTEPSIRRYPASVAASRRFSRRTNPDAPASFQEVDMRDEPRPIISPVGPIYTTEDTAALLKCSVRTVQRLIRDRQLRSYKVGRVYRILHIPSSLVVMP
jgi:excisionase family DNA binding protein